jgi:hypothetical protein
MSILPTPRSVAANLFRFEPVGSDLGILEKSATSQQIRNKSAAQVCTIWACAFARNEKRIREEKTEYPTEFFSAGGRLGVPTAAPRVSDTGGSFLSVPMVAGWFNCRRFLDELLAQCSTGRLVRRRE